MTARRARALAGPILVAVLTSVAPVPAPLSASPMPDSADGSPAEALEIVALANEGALLRAGDTTVAIDATIVRAYPPYGALAPGTWRAMLDGEAPFEDLDLLLVSHPHPDHVDAEATAQLLRARPELRLISSPPVIDAVRSALGDAAAGRLETVAPAPGEVIERTVGAARVRFLRLRHGGRSYDELWNLGHVIELGDGRALHVGDAEGDARTFESYDLTSFDLDVALLPYWVYWSETAEGLLDAPSLVALHVPPAEIAEVRADLARRGLEVSVPDAMERLERPEAP